MRELQDEDLLALNNLIYLEAEGAVDADVWIEDGVPGEFTIRKLLEKSIDMQALAADAQKPLEEQHNYSGEIRSEEWLGMLNSIDEEVLDMTVQQVHRDSKGGLMVCLTDIEQQREALAFINSLPYENIINCTFFC